ncbi:MAG: methylated-DNA--[protein]-cysteine S-methyltransferase [FCB group bacterium]|nr:methylated-DNA--[protein]-cysteine S-methyltransferase [FCB group bacterium]
MKENKLTQSAEDYFHIGQAIEFVEANFKSQPTLEEIARSANLSKFHFQRLFKRWVGVSPTRFMQFLTLEYTKRQLDESKSVLDASYDAGLSGPGRLHDLFVNFEAMTPGEYKRLGSDLRIEYGFHPSPFGECLLAMTERGVCFLGFVHDGGRSAAIMELRRNWPLATVSENKQKTKSIIGKVFALSAGRGSTPFHLHLKGTNFQVQVWRALLTIPAGNVVSYGDIAAYLGKPKAYRAVANTVAINPVSFLIPCHRVITSSGLIHKYRWGATRKKAILGWEAAQVSGTSDFSA